ncbi:hypothetical protein [Novosphingobium sp. Gsoil 351]|uniref:hypothetical protein n=1 Tax=Novosphingobium sp. Gsoil 351 TaxID=2675225 RepID=UPI0012B4C0DA|nr:hypothetical protein [Novosphingobium sp. Gsoil 351]QGN55792.1 hypothetical protein GKE62_15800 [Novosphingobium sp. Gsoil 351]
MPVSERTAIERIARVLAGQRLSSNAKGGDPSAAEAVDMEWEAHTDDAIAVLKTLREPDEPMASAGDGRVWSAMIEAALGHWEFDAETPPSAS